ncbi:MAG: glycosyltransferase [Verrucomicrobiota bacterium]
MTTILHVIQQLSLGGGTRTLVAVSKQSARIGAFRHRVISLAPGAPEAVTLARSAGIPVVDAPDTATTLREMAGADIVQVEWWNSPEMQMLLHRELPPMRMLVWYHVCGDGAPQIITPQLASMTDLNVATNPWTARELPVFRDLSPEERAQRVASVIPGAEFDRLQGVTARVHKGFDIGYIGTVDFVKMHRRYVPMSAAVRVPEGRFVVCGAGGALATLQAEARELGAVERFDFRGFVSDIKPVIEGLDVYGYPLCEDTYASGELNLQEIMYAGVPPVVFPHGGVRGLIEHEKTGLVVRTETEYRDAIEHLYHHPEERKRLGEAARAHARQHFGAQNAAREMNPLYTRLLERPKRSRAWGCRPDRPSWEEPVTSLDLVDLPSGAAGTRLFLEGLGGNDGHFLASLTEQNPDALFVAEEAISNCSTLVRSRFSGGILNYGSAFPGEGWLRLWAGLVLRQEGRMPAAIEEFAAAIDHGCSHWRVGWYIAQTAAQHGDTKLAGQAARMVLKSAPGFGPAKVLLATLVQPSNTGALVGAARAAVVAGNIEECEAALTEALALEPDHQGALLLQAELDVQSGRFPNAAQTCLRLLQTNPSSVPPLLLLAASFVGAGEIQAARDTYLRILELEPGNAIAAKAQDDLGAGSPTDCAPAPLPAAATEELLSSPSLAPATPRVSAIVSAYNSERFLRGCLEDLERQTIASQLEIIVVDTASPQNERAIAEKFQQRFGNVVYLRTEERETVYGAWNRGIRAARGRYLTNANTDDRHRRDALERMVAALEANPAVALVYGDCLATTVENETFETTTSARELKWLGFNPQVLLEKGCFVGPQPMWRREVHETHGYFDDKMVSSGDYEFWLRLAGTRDFLHLKETLGLYLESPTSVQHANNDQAIRESRHAQDLHRAAIMARVNRLAPVATPQRETTTAPIPATSLLSGSLVLPPCALVGNLREARQFFEQKKLPAAWGATRAALKHRPFHPEAYLLLAEIALAAQASVAARDCAQFARQIAPEFRPAKKFLKGKIYGNAKPDWLVLPEEIGKHKAEGRHHLSVCLIVKNEERFLGRCLASIKGLAHQIVVVDTGSTDRTVEIAREHGAQVHAFAWCDDFSAARNAALEHATGDWVLMLDADEDLPTEQQAALRKLLRATEVIAWRLPLQDVGSEAEGCNYVPRLFRNAPGVFYVGRVHEQVFASIEVRRQEWGLETRLGDATLRHYGYTKELTLERDKVGRNLRLLEQAILEMPGETNLLMNYGLELTRSGRPAEGLAQYRAAFTAMAALPPAVVVPETREMLLSQFCTQLMAAKRYAEIVQALTSPLAKQGGGLTASLHFTLGLAQMELKEFAAAAEQFRQCLAKRDRPALTPVNLEIRKAGPRHCLALCLEQMGETDAAAEEFRLALETEPLAWPVRHDYARFLATHDRQIEALNLFFVLAGEKPGEPQVWLQGGQLALTRPEFLEVALDWTAEAERHLPDDPAVVQQRAEALMLAGQCSMALPLWRRWPSGSNPALAAALVLCETVAGENQFSPAPAAEVAVSREFVNWYQRLLRFNAQPTVEALNARVEGLQRVLPSAAGILTSALAEASAEIST